jgi:hypothetical protein
LNRSLQLYGLAALTAIAIALLILIAWVLYLIGSHIGADGKVPSAEAFGFTALLLAFREVIGAVKGLWEHEDRAQLTQHLAASLPAAERDVLHLREPLP